MAVKKRIDYVSALGFGAPATPEDDVLNSLNNQIKNSSMRLSALGIDPTPRPPEPSLLEKTLRVLNLPGATVRSLIHEGVDKEQGINWGRAFSRDRLWDNQVGTQDILETAGVMKPLGENASFGQKAGRFAVGLAGDLLTDPLSWVAGGITRPLQVLRAPVIGKPIAQIGRQGLAQPLLRGVGAGLRGTGALGAALGDEGVRAAREAASRASTRAGGGASALATAVANRSPRELTRAERLGLSIGTSIRESDRGRGLVQAFSPNSLIDPTYAQMRSGLARRVGDTQRARLNELDSLVAKLTPEQQRLVTDLAESSGERALYAYRNPETGAITRLEEEVGADAMDPVRQLQERARQARGKSPAATTALPERLSKRLQGKQPWEMTADEFAAAVKEPDYRAPIEPTLNGVARTGQPGYQVEQQVRLALPDQPEVPIGTVDGLTPIAVTYRDESGKALGALKFEVDPQGVPVTPPSVYVDEAARRQGIATQLYETARRAGYDLSGVSGQVLTEDGARLYHARAVRDASARGENVPDTVRVAYNGLTPRGREIAGAVPEAKTLIDDASLEVLPDNVYQAFKYVTETLSTYGHERLRRGLLGSLLDNYFPHKLTPEAREAMGLTPGGGSAGLRQQSAKYREIRQPLKQIKGQSYDPGFEHEFVRPFAREVVESVRSVETFDFLEEVNRQFGIKSDDMLARFGRNPNETPPAMLEGYKLVNFGEFLVGGKESQAFSKLGKVYLPKDIAEDVTRLWKAYNTDEGTNAFLKLWDGASNFWKPLVTTLNPSFHVNNALGNFWNMFLGGVDNPTRLRDGYDVFLGKTGTRKVGEHTIDFQTLHRLARENGVINSGFFESETGRDVYRLLREGSPKPVNDNAMRDFYQQVQSAGRHVGSAVEGVSRATLFADQMYKRVADVQGELTDEVLKRIARDAAEHTNKYLFDYAHGLSKFENDVMRRVAPFYSWTRFNIPLQVAEVINQPGKFLLYDKVKDNLAHVNPYPDDTPPWLREALPTGIGTAEGGQVFWNPRLPMQDISRLSPGDSGREVLGMLNPFIKVPLELATNKNFFTGRENSEYPGQTTQIVGGARVPVEAAHVVSSTAGVFSKGPAALKAMSPDATSTDRLRIVRTFFPGLFTYNPERQRVSNAYAEVNRLNDLMRKYRDETGQDIPTVRELHKQGRSNPLGF